MAGCLKPISEHLPASCGRGSNEAPAPALIPWTGGREGLEPRLLLTFGAHTRSRGAAPKAPIWNRDLPGVRPFLGPCSAIAGNRGLNVEIKSLQDRYLSYYAAMASAAAEEIVPGGARNWLARPLEDRSAERRSEDSLDPFLTALREFPLLSPARVKHLAEEIREGERLFRESLYRIPGAAVMLVEDWNERRRSGRVTGLLSHHYRDRPDESWTDLIDEKLEHLERLVSQLAGHRAAAPRPRSRVISEIREVMASAEILFEVLQEIARELRTHLDADGLAAVSCRGRELGLDAPASRAALRRAELSLARRDEARKTMASHNLRLVVHVAKRYRGPGVPFSDLIQDGCIGLMRAVDKFDPSLGYRFSTYAVWWIEQAVIRAIQANSRTVRVPSHIYDAQLQLRDSERQLRLRVGEPNRDELAATLDLSEEQIELAFSSQKPIRSLEKPADDSDGLSIAERLSDPNAADPDDRLDLAKLQETLASGLDGLEPRERKVLSWRFGLGGVGELTLQEIGTRLGISRERVRQIQNRALEKLRGQNRINELRGALSENSPSQTRRRAI